MNKLFYKIGINTGIQVLGKVLSVALGFITVFLLTRYLGSSGYGNFTLVFTYLSFFSVIADLGLQTAMVREIAQNETTNRHYGNFLLLKIGLVIVSSICAIVALFFFPYSMYLKTAILIGVAAVGISGISTYGTVILQARLRLDLVTLIDIITKIFTVGFIVLFVYFNFGFYWIISTVLFGNIVGFIVSAFLLEDTIHFDFHIPYIKQMLIASIPIGITTFLGLAYFKIDTIMLSVMRNSTEVGLYSLPYKVLENLVVVWGFYMASVYPLFAKLKGENKTKELLSLLKHSFFIALVLSFPIIAFGILFSNVVVQIFAGSGFGGSVFSLRILLFSLPFLFLTNLFSNFFFSIHKNSIVFWGIVVSLVANFVLNLIYIPQYGYIAASWITVLSAIIFTIYCIIQIVLYDFIF